MLKIVVLLIVSLFAFACLGQQTCADTNSNCAGIVAYCTNPSYLSLMQQQCRRTCGFCSGTTTPTPSPTCVDLTNPNTGISDCPSRAYLCNNPTYQSLMRTQCPRTCGFCSGTTNPTPSPTTCVDLTNPSTGVSDCTRMAYLCTNAAYLTLMRQQCPRTCGYCS